MSRTIGELTAPTDEPFASHDNPASGRRTSGGVSWITVGVVFLLFVNVAGVLVDTRGAPAIVGAGVIFLLGIPLIAGMRHERLTVPTTLVIMLAYLLAQILSAVLAGDAREPFRLEIQQYLVEGIFLFFALVNTIRTPDVLRKVLWAIALGGAFLGLVTVHQWATGAWSQPYKGFAQLPIDYLSGYATSPRSNGPVGDPNYFAQIMLIPVAIIPFMIRNERTRIARIALVGALALCFAAILLTYSRGAGFALLLVLIAAIVMREVKLQTLLITALIGTIVLVTIPEYRDRIASVTTIGKATEEAGTEDAADISIRGRATEMRAAAAAFQDHPLTGVGPGMFPSRYQEYAQRIGLEVHENVRFGEGKGEVPEREAHNLLLGLAADVGIFGLVCFLGALGVTFVGLVRARRRARPELKNLLTGLLLALMAYVAAGLFLSFAFERYYWMLLALCAAGVLLAEPAPAAESPTPSRRGPDAMEPLG
jgi:O-antigen ligase